MDICFLAYYTEICVMKPDQLLDDTRKNMIFFIWEQGGKKISTEALGTVKR